MREEEERRGGGGWIGATRKSSSSSFVGAARAGGVAISIPGWILLVMCVHGDGGAARWPVGVTSLEVVAFWHRGNKVSTDR